MGASEDEGRDEDNFHTIFTSIPPRMKIHQTEKVKRSLAAKREKGGERKGGGGKGWGGGGRGRGVYAFNVMDRRNSCSRPPHLTP